MATIRVVGSTPKSIVFFSKSIADQENPKNELGKQEKRKESFSWVPVFLIPKIPYKCGMKICSLSILFAVSALAQPTSVEKIAEGELPSLLAIYKDVHSHP